MLGHELVPPFFCRNTFVAITFATGGIELKMKILISLKRQKIKKRHTREEIQKEINYIKYKKAHTKNRLEAI